MQLQIRNSENFGAGLVFVALGSLTVFLGSGYPLGSGFRMGPGVFPIGLGAILCVLGLVIAIGALRGTAEADQESSKWPLRPWLVLPGALVVFGLLLYLGAGFVPGLVALVIGSALAHRDVHVLETTLLAVFIPLACVGIFIFGLGLPYRLFWWS